MTYYSQIGQDKSVLKYYSNKKNGFFVEIGANDGITLSNTYALESYDWKGILVECLPTAYKKLVINRPNVICVEYAAYSESGLELKFTCNDLLSGITNKIDKYDAQGEYITVKTKTLTDILDDAKAPTFIEYISIDTEGSELEVLKGIDFDKYMFGYISIEHNYVEPRRAQMREFLEGKGYRFYKENQFDDDYVLF